VLAIDVAGSIRSRRVIDVLARLISLHGTPAHLRSDSGPEFVSHATLKWLTDNRIDTGCDARPSPDLSNVAKAIVAFEGPGIRARAN